MLTARNEIENESWPTGKSIERRRFSRHQLIDRIFIVTDNGTFTGTSSEISRGGMSAATLGNLHVGRAVDVKPVLGQRIRAIVRRNQGTTFGFEFIDLPSGVKERIKTLCETLPLFHTTADI
jgi:c-di-GMP-binding flagellar brake protein YcgR